MRRAILLVGCLVACGVCGGAEEPPAEKVPHTLYEAPYFERNDSGLGGGGSHLRITRMQDLEKTFGVAFVMGPRPKLIGEKTFEDQQVLAIIRRGNAVAKYAVQSVQKQGNTVTVNFTVKWGEANPATRFSSPLLIAIPKEGIEAIRFVEDGKEVGAIPEKK